MLGIVCSIMMWGDLSACGECCLNCDLGDWG